MKFYKSLLSIIYIVVIFAYPSKKDFSEAFIQVAKVGNPAVVSIVSEKIVESNFTNFLNLLVIGSQKKNIRDIL